jgi:hypothetical protein
MVVNDNEREAMARMATFLTTAWTGKKDRAEWAAGVHKRAAVPAWGRAVYCGRPLIGLLG